MTLKKTIKTTGGLPLLAWLVIGLMLFLAKSVQAGDNGQLPEFNTTRPYLIYYGNWTAGQADYVRRNCHRVFLHLASNITSNITNSPGMVSVRGTQYASYNLNARNDQTGFPDEHANFGSDCVTVGAPGKRPSPLAADIAVMEAAQKAVH